MSIILGRGPQQAMIRPDSSGPKAHRCCTRQARRDDRRVCGARQPMHLSKSCNRATTRRLAPSHPHVPARRCDGHHGPLRPHGGAEPHRAIRCHTQSMGPDNVRPAAPPRSRLQVAPRPEHTSCCGTWCGTLPGPCEGGDDGLVGPGAPRVLRRHRGRRNVPDRAPRVAYPPGLGRSIGFWPDPHPRRGWWPTAAGRNR